MSHNRQSTTQSDPIPLNSLKNLHKSRTCDAGTRSVSHQSKLVVLIHLLINSSHRSPWIVRGLYITRGHYLINYYQSQWIFRSSNETTVNPLYQIAMAFFCILENYNSIIRNRHVVISIFTHIYGKYSSSYSIFTLISHLLVMITIIAVTLTCSTFITTCE